MLQTKDMTKHHRIKGLILLVILAYTQMSESCPLPCKCTLVHKRMDVECSGKNAWTNNTRFPPHTFKLQIRDTVVSTEIMEGILAHMSELNNLTLRNIGIHSLSTRMFAGLPKLQELQLLQSESIRVVETGVFSPLVELMRFRISGNERVRFKTIANAIGEAHLLQLKTGIIDHQGTLEKFHDQPVLDVHFFKMFENNSIETVAITNDNIQTIRHGFSQYVKDIRCLVLRGNVVTREWRAILEIGKLKKLRYLDASKQGNAERHDDVSDINAVCKEPLPRDTEVKHLDKKLVQETQKRMNERCIWIIPVAPNMRYVFIDNSLILGTVVVPKKLAACFNLDNAVRYIDSSNNNLDIRREVMGLLRLQFYNLQHNHIRDMSPQNFANFPSLVTLLFGGNKLGKSFAKGNATSTLNTLHKLTTLDIASNNISKMSVPDLGFVMNIKNVNLSNNIIQPEHINFSMNFGFKFLNMSNNKLTKLPQKFRESLDRYAKGNPIKIDLSGNPIICSCDNFDFLDWLIDHKNHFINFASYTCFFDGKKQHITKSTINNLHYICKNGKTKTILASVFGIIAILVILILTIRQRNYIMDICVFRLQIRLKRLVLKFQNYEQLINQEDFDVFVAYSYHDSQMVLEKVKPQLTRRGLKLCISEEEFRAGESTVKYIDTAIDRCRCTLLIVSQKFVESRWCSYEILSSLAMKKRVIVLALTDIKRHEMPPGLIYLGRKTRQIYPRGDDEATHLRFWDKLAGALKANDDQLGYIAAR